MNRPICLQKLPSSHQPCLLFYVFLHHLQSLLWSTFLLDVWFPFRLPKGKLFGLRICLFWSSAGPKYLSLIQMSTAQCFQLFSAGCLPFRKNLFERWRKRDKHRYKKSHIDVLWKSNRTLWTWKLSNSPQVLTDHTSILTFSIWLPWWVTH